MCIIFKFIHIDRSLMMRTNIEIDDVLMANVLKTTGLKTKKEAVDMGLRTLLQLKQQEGFKALRGQLHWSGDLDAMRGAEE